MSKYVIEKNVPIPPRQNQPRYTYKEIPFDQMEVGDCMKIPLSELIPNNLHPDTRERAMALACLANYLRRKYSDKVFTHRVDRPVPLRKFSPQAKEEAKQANLNRYVRVWRVQ